MKITSIELNLWYLMVIHQPALKIVVDVLKYEGQCPNLIYVLVILINLLRHAMSLMIILRCLQYSLSSPRVNKLLHFSIGLMNSSFNNKFQIMTFLQGISLKS